MIVFEWRKKNFFRRVIFRDESEENWRKKFSLKRRQYNYTTAFWTVDFVEGCNINNFTQYSMSLNWLYEPMSERFSQTSSMSEYPHRNRIIRNCALLVMVSSTFRTAAAFATHACNRRDVSNRLRLSFIKSKRNFQLINLKIWKKTVNNCKTYRNYVEFYWVTLTARLIYGHKNVWNKSKCSSTKISQAE